MKYILILLLLISFSAQAQFKCVNSASNCENANDSACRFASRIWSTIKDKEDEWAKFLRIDIFDSKNSIKYSSFSQFCLFRGYKGRRDGQIDLVILKDTKTEQSYQVFHTACGQDSFFVETWKIQGQDLKPISKPEIKKNILFSLERKFDLKGSETYKSFSLESKAGPYESYEGNFVPFSPFRADKIIEYITQQVQVKDGLGVLSNEVKSFVKIFDKKLFNQTINTTKEETRMQFFSPAYPFYGDLHRRFFNFSEGQGLCDTSTVDISFNNYLLIKSTKDQSNYGLTFDQYQKLCLSREVTNYRDRLILVLEHRINQFFPRFAEENTDQNLKLEDDIKNIINFIEAGDITTSLDLVRKLLQEVRDGEIKDER